MTQLDPLPSLNPIPDDIEAHLKRLLEKPGEPELGEWLFELIRGSGHMSSSDELRWRVLCMIWLAAEFDMDRAWPYLMWLNMNEPVLAPHLSEIVIEAVDNLEAQVQMANWLARTTDERWTTFFKDFRLIPTRRKIGPLVGKLLNRPDEPETGVWLAIFCQGTVDDDNLDLRPWRLLTGAWYAACFNPEEGVNYLKTLTKGVETLSPADNKLLMEAAGEVNGLTTLIQAIADCPDPAVKTMLKDFGHPDLPTVVETIFQSHPDYSHLADATEQASLDADTFKRNLDTLKQASLSSNKTATILELACGPLASQTLLLNSAGYRTVGVDLHIPPGYLPVSGVRQWFKRGRHATAWKTATAPYYQALARQTDMKLRWNKVKIKLADLPRLDVAEGSFDAVVCANYLQHAPDVAGLLAEAARVLKPGGWLLANIYPYAGLNGAFQGERGSPWSHLREQEQGQVAPSFSLNKWREGRYRETLEGYFSVEQWLPESDPQAQALLTSAIRAELEDYEEEELTRKQIVVVARKY